LKSLFKYMPLREDFFRDPLFRLTPPYDLNDPFDSKPTKEAIRKKIAFMTDRIGEGAGYISDEEVELKHGDLSRHLQTELHRFGIISMTENPRNLLMWSHYADEHRGIVVELYNSEDTFKHSKSEFHACRLTAKEAVRVIYDQNRPSKNIPDECIFSIYEDAFFKHFALVKSDHWMHEKEHRFIVPTSHADIAMFTLNDKNLPVSGLEDYLTQRNLPFSRKEDCFLFEHENLDHLISSFGKTIGDQNLNSLGHFRYYKRANPDSIRGIYFGCKVSDTCIRSAMSMVLKNQRFSANLNFYQAKESSDRFEIEFFPIHEKSI